MYKSDYLPKDLYLDPINLEPTSCVLKGIVISSEVQKALKEGQPVVALESTIISHGMPFSKNLETANAVEQVVRDNGAIPATIAIIGGVPHVGLSKSELHHIASRWTQSQVLSFIPQLWMCWAALQLPEIQGRKIRSRYLWVRLVILP